MGEMEKVKVLIIGAGKAGELLSKEIINNNDNVYHIIGFLDDDMPSGKIINNKPILGPVDKLAQCVKEFDIQEVIIAVPSKRGDIIRSIISDNDKSKILYKILPNISDVLLQDFDEGYLRFVRPVEVEDLLGGQINKSDQEEIKEFAANKTIMITGAAGSIGSELSRQIASLKSGKVIFYDWWENGMFELRNQVLGLHPDGDYEFIIGDVKDAKRVEYVISTFKPNTVFHAAAYKHVPLMEHNSSEAIKNNILGTKTVAEIAAKYTIEKFILVSTDKAVNPTNVMGATKRAAEKIIHTIAASQNVTKLCAVRFGNVINSNGSAIPFFERQIEKGGPVTVTHEEVTRFFMTIPEAVHLVLQAWILGENDDLFVLEMGEPVKILDLAKWLITLKGYSAEEIKINIIGLRPGEKLYEEVLVDEESNMATSVKKIYRTTNHMNFDISEFMINLNNLLEYAKSQENNELPIRNMLKKMIETYHPSTQ